MSDTAALAAFSADCFRRACRLDVAVRKPGNVSLESAGHGMQARQFVDSGDAAAGPLSSPGAGVGARIEAAVEASWAVAGCNTNLGIVLLCAPLMAAAERRPARGDRGAWRAAVDAVLAALDIDDAARAYRAIARANPGGLGAAPQQDVQAPPTVTLREAMALAAHRDLIARQYAEGFDGLFEVADPLIASGFSPIGLADALAPPPGATACVQRLYLRILGRWPDSHIVRKHGEAVAQSVLHAAQGWQGVERPGEDPRWAAWDATLKAAGINPGTSADLTVAALLLAGLVLH